MRIEKRFRVAATPDRIWSFITNPELVAPCIPGCQDVEVIEPGRYRASIKVQVGPISAAFSVSIEARELRPPQFAEYAIQGDEGGKASRLSATSRLTISQLEDTECEVTYASEISISGRLGKFGAGVMKKIADNLGEKFVQSLTALVEAQ